MDRPLPADYHTHNVRCGHARGTIADYVHRAEEVGVREIACTDHLPIDDRFGVESRMPVAEFSAYLDEVQEAADAASLPVLLGVEADYYRGCEASLESMLNRHPFDVVLGSVHFRDYFSTDPIRRGVSDPDHPEALWNEYFTLVAELARTQLYDIVGHIDLPKRFGMSTDPALIERSAGKALDAIAEAGMAIEINTSGAIHPMQEVYPGLTLLRWARERDIPLTFGSDAHDPHRVGDGFADAVALAREAGYTDSAFFRQRQRTLLPLPVLDQAPID